MASVKGVTRFSVSLPPSLVRDFDDAWKSMGYENRSRAAHDAFRSFITDHKWVKEEAEELIGAIVLLYYPGKHGLLNKIMEIQHEFESVISSTMHVHLTREKCLEIIAVKGTAGDAKELAQKLTAIKGVKQLKFAAMVP